MSNLSDQFIIEEYKQKFDYLKHIENLRQRFLQIYLIITGSILAIIQGDLQNNTEIKLQGLQNINEIKFEGLQNFTEIKLEVIHYALLIFLLLYSIGLQIYFSSQKNNYNYYKERIRALEKEITKYSKKPENKFSVFESLVLLNSLISGAILFLILYTFGVSIYISVTSAIIWVVAVWLLNKFILIVQSEKNSKEN